MTTPQLTDEQIDAEFFRQYQGGASKGDKHVFRAGARFARALLAQPAVAHERKVLEDVEPVAWMGVSGVGERIVSKTQMYPFMTTPLYPAHTVAALAARVAELEKDALRYRLIRSEMAVESGLSVQRGKSRRKIVVKALMAWWPGVGPVASGSDEDIDAAIDAALAAKGQA